MMIYREDFVEHYPQLLLEITLEADTSQDREEGDVANWQYPGVDICFKDLSLSIQVGSSTINVVDKVTGRIRAKTMTALMGGSGAGKAIICSSERASYVYIYIYIYINKPPLSFLTPSFCA